MILWLSLFQTWKCHGAGEDGSWLHQGCRLPSFLPPFSLQHQRDLQDSSRNDARGTLRRILQTQLPSRPNASHIPFQCFMVSKSFFLSVCKITTCPIASCKWFWQKTASRQAEQDPNLPCSASNVTQLSLKVGQVELLVGQVNFRGSLPCSASNVMESRLPILFFLVKRSVLLFSASWLGGQYPYLISNQYLCLIRKFQGNLVKFFFLFYIEGKSTFLINVS